MDWQKLIESAESMMLSDEKMYKWVWLGECIGVDELIYYMFGNRNIIQPGEDQRYSAVLIGGDYGQQNATTFQAFGLDLANRKLQGITEFYHSERETGKQMPPSQYAEKMIELLDEVHERTGTDDFYVFLDPSARGLAKEIKRELLSKPRPYRAVMHDAQNDVALGISRVQKALIFDILRISPEQKNLIRNLECMNMTGNQSKKGERFLLRKTITRLTPPDTC